MAVNRASDWNLAFDDFDSFRDLAHLARMTVGKIEERIPGAHAFFFIHNLGLREYREEDKEGMFSLSEDNPLITYLALKNRIIDRKNLRKDAFFKDDSINAFLLIEQLGIGTLIPLVYRFELLGFLGIRMPAGKEKLESEERKYCNTLRRELLQNLYAAVLIDQRFSELVTLSDLGKELSSIATIPELYAVFFGKLRQLLGFDQGSLWICREEGSSAEVCRTLELMAWDGYEVQAGDKQMQAGASVSGYVFQAGKPLLIKDLHDNSFFFDRNREPHLSHSVLSLPLKTNDTVIGVVTLHNRTRQGGFTGETLHLVSILCSTMAATIAGKRLYNKLEKGYLDTITALVAALDAKDPYHGRPFRTGMHYAEGIATELGLPTERIRILRFAALLHDIGKIGIKGEIIRKNRN
jgi:HD-GYP domain-containing protein (c-di-GMP phosphodiesterase class II)